MNSKDFYATYQADPNISELGYIMLDIFEISQFNTVLEFGCGEGKHLRHLNGKGIETFGIDLSILNVIRAQSQNKNIGLGDESSLKFFGNIDCVFTVSVLDHIENIDEVIKEFKRIATKAIYLLETNDTPAQFYYPHKYESYGFTKLSYKWKSKGDGATYHIWHLIK